MIGMLLLNRYELIEKIGEGGMGIIYKAKCHLLDRFVTVKILKEELNSDNNFLQRFNREAISIGSLSHINIVNVYDAGKEKDLNFIVMEYIDGKTLKQIIKDRGPFNYIEVRDIALQIAQALQCAHKNNIIHRDIKPDNILLTEDNIVKVTDFGIAKAIDSQTITSDNKITGSVHYLSPEQAKGGRVDCRSDIYSLGVVMYEMITGKVPFNAESPIAVAMMHIQEAVISPKAIINDIPEDINQVILKALEKDADKRYQSAKELSQALIALKGDPTSKVIPESNKNDFTRIMEPIIISKKGKLSKGKKAIILLGSFIIFIIIGVSGNYLSNLIIPKDTTAVANTSVKATPPEKILVPSLIGSNQADAERTIVSSGFFIGDISSEYSDSVSKGIVISQSPQYNTSYEKGSSINLVISLGKSTVNVTPTQPKGKKNHK